jgi:hypothetical protein
VAYVSRSNSAAPSPAPINELRKVPSRETHQPSVESPLRKQSFPFNDTSRLREESFHFDPPARISDKVTGGGPADGTIDLGPKGGNTEDEGGWFVERGTGTPILASDEVFKRPSSAFLQPAVDPEEVRHDHSDYEDDVPPSRRSSLRPNSRPSSRPNSVHGGYQGGPLHRFISHEEHHTSGMGTPLEEIEEYEPLFPEDEKDENQPRVFKKRPGLAQHHFPSQDIWEDTPDSLRYQTTVQTPEPPVEVSKPPEEVNPATVFETPEQEEARKTENPEDMTSDNKTFAKPHFKPGVLEEANGARPGVQRFPSHDIWEDTPDSMRLVTTVSSPQMDETKSPPEDRPTTAALPLRQDEADARSTTGFTQNVRPSVPARPERKSKLAQEIKPDHDDPREKNVPDLGSTREQMLDRSKPTIPDRPKPTVPARPARPSHSDHAEGAPLAKTISAGSDDTVVTAPEKKAKPAVPARPAGGKIAALQSTFMNDLNNRLKLGPQAAAPKPKEPEAEADDAPKEPLADARKGRARGPARRKQAASPSAPSSGAAGFSFSAPLTLWHIDERDELQVAALEAEQKSVDAAEPADAAAKEAHNAVALEREMSVNEEHNTSEPAMHTKSASVTAGSTDVHPREVIGAEGDKPDSAVSSAIAEEHEAVQPELEKALASAEPASANAEEIQAKEEKEVASQAVQTGQKDMEVTSPEGEKQHITAYVGGQAQTDGDVVVKDGE